MNISLSFVQQKKGLCLFLSTLLDTATPILNAVANKKLPPVISQQLNSALASIPQNISLGAPSPIDLHWGLTNQSGSSIDGIGLQFVLDVLLKSPTGDKIAPFTPQPPLPGILTLLQQNQVLFDFTDSLLNNIIYSLGPKFDKEYDFKANGFKIKLTLAKTPTVKFTNQVTGRMSVASVNFLVIQIQLRKFFIYLLRRMMIMQIGPSAASLTIVVHVVASKLPLRISAIAVMVASFAVEVCRLFTTCVQL